MVQNWEINWVLVFFTAVTVTVAAVKIDSGSNALLWAGVAFVALFATAIDLIFVWLARLGR